MNPVTNNTQYVAEATIKTTNDITIYAGEGVPSELYSLLEENNKARCIENSAYKSQIEEILDERIDHYIDLLSSEDKPRLGRPRKVENQDTPNTQNNKK
jgi:cobalamin biosynthesis protein CbiD